MRKMLILILLMAMASCQLGGTFRPWNTDSVYSKGDQVSGYPGTIWESVRDDNAGHYPPTSPDWWTQPRIPVVYQ